jgi:SOS-response transcriptional repressor LexA
MTIDIPIENSIHASAMKGDFVVIAVEGKCTLKTLWNKLKTIT